MRHVTLNPLLLWIAPGLFSCILHEIQLWLWFSTVSPKIPKWGVLANRLTMNCHSGSGRQRTGAETKRDWSASWAWDLHLNGTFGEVSGAKGAATRQKYVWIAYRNWQTPRINGHSTMALTLAGSALISSYSKCPKGAVIHSSNSQIPTKWSANLVNNLASCSNSKIEDFRARGLLFLMVMSFRLW